ncbi:MAG TPA: hypothetical protein PK986_08150 [Spirochaetota bacterium]|nr:hypothetical protein [Spirochaetota bacterium]
MVRGDYDSWFFINIDARSKMDSQERAGLIRKGNELFNQGEINEAMKLFVRTRYGDGIMRIADFYYYEKKQPLIALKFYRMINRSDRIEEINSRMMFAFKKMIMQQAEEASSPEAQEIEVKVHPKLKILAEEILRDKEKEKD